MEDQQIVALYWERSESAIVETDQKYGRYCYQIAYNILENREDSEESVSDTYLDAWYAIPPHRPSILSTFLGKITRRISIDRWRSRNADKRGGGEILLALDELEDCISDGCMEQEVSRRELVRIIRRFLWNLRDTERCVFLRRYWYLESTENIAEDLGFSQSKVTSMLYRIRKKLGRELEKEGYV